jgi:hypothetical protein
VNPAFADCHSKYWPEAVPPEPYGLVADINAPFKQDVFDLAQRQLIKRTTIDQQRLLHREA